MRFAGSVSCMLLAAVLVSGCGGAPDTGNEDFGTAREPYSAPVSACTKAAIRAGAPDSAQGMLDRAYVWINNKIMYCQCVETGTSGYRADCSGYVSYIWNQAKPGNTTSRFPNGPYDNGHAKAITWSQLTIGDALNYSGNLSTGSGHVMLFAGWVNSAHTKLCSIEESHSGTPAHIGQHSLSDPGSWWLGSGTFKDIFQPIRKTGYVPNDLPKGYLDSAGCSAIKGWSQDPDTPKKAISVQLFFDGKAGASGTTKVTTTANVTRQDLCGPLGSCNHGFSVAPPSKLLDGQSHSVYAYGIDSTTGKRSLLKSTPKTLKCAPPSTGTGGSTGVGGAGGASNSDAGAMGGASNNDGGATGGASWVDGGAAGGAAGVGGSGTPGEQSRVMSGASGSCSVGSPGTTGEHAPLWALAGLLALVVVRRRGERAA